MWLLWHSPIEESGEYSKLVRGTLRVSTLGKQLSAKRDTNDFWLVDKIVVRVCKQSMSKPTQPQSQCILSHNIITYYSPRIGE